MKRHMFTLLFERADVSDILDALFEAGCDDAIFGEREGQAYADFDRSAASFPEAVISAIDDVERATPNLQVTRVEPEVLVSAADIAARMDRSRESIRLLVEGRRGPGSFPYPALWVGDRPFWQWADVASWFESYLGQPVADRDDAEFIAAMNGALEMRRHVAHLDAREEERVRDWVQSRAYPHLQSA
jgi:hypothetical protein